MTIPPDTKVKEFFGVVKGLSRDAAKRLLPQKVLMRKKSPYPKTFNPGYELIVKMKLRNVMDDPQPPIHKLVDDDAVYGLLESQPDYGKPFFGQLIAALQMMAWLWQINLWLETYHITF